MNKKCVVIGLLGVHLGRSEDAVVLSSCLDDTQISQMDRFDRVQVAEVIRVCRHSRSLSHAGRTLFAESRKAKAKPNDADRLRKYLQCFGLSWDDRQ